jgi:hypothetical protein
MKTIAASVLALLFVTICTAQTGAKSTANRLPRSYESVLVYSGTTTSIMGQVSYLFKDTRGETVEFVSLDEKNSNLKQLFENGNVKEATTAGDFTVKESVGKKFRLKYKVEKGQENLAWAAKTIISATEVIEPKKQGN